MQIFWFIPTHGDSRYLGTSEGSRAVDYDYLRQVGSAADSLGYDGVLLPTAAPARTRGSPRPASSA